MPDPLEEFPATLRQGDTLEVQVSLSDFPASSWTLTYFLSGPTSELEQAATADGDDHLLSLTPEQTAELGVEVVGWVAKASKDGDVFTALSGTVQVLADLATSGPIDTRSHAQKVLAAIQATIEGRATNDQQEYTIKDRSLKRMSVEELLAFKKEYERLVALELRNGQRNILATFTRIT